MKQSLDMLHIDEATSVPGGLAQRSLSEAVRRMADGSCHFAELPETYDVQDPEWDRLHRHLQAPPGVTVTGFLTDQVTEAWVDFAYRGYRFSLNNPKGRWWLIVADPACPDEILAAAYALCAAALPSG